MNIDEQEREELKKSMKLVNPKEQKEQKELDPNQIHEK